MVTFCRVCGFRVRVWESYRTSRSFGYRYESVTVVQNFQKFRVLWHGCTELTGVPSGYERCCTRTPGIVAKDVQNSQKFRVRV